MAGLKIETVDDRSPEWYNPWSGSKEVYVRPNPYGVFLSANTTGCDLIAADEEVKLTPEQRLYCAVLASAVSEYRRGATAKNARDRSYREDAIRSRKEALIWLANRVDNPWLSVVDCCHALGYPYPGWPKILLNIDAWIEREGGRL